MAQMCEKNNSSPVKKILLVGPAWVGDMVMAQTIFKQLKLMYQDVILDVLAPPATLPLLQRMPEINQGIEIPIGHGRLALMMRYKIGRKLRKEGYDQAILLTNSLKSALIPFWAKVPVRTGWLGEQRWGFVNDVRHLDKYKLPLMIQRFVALALGKTEEVPDKIPRPALVCAASAVEAALTKHNLAEGEVPVLALCPGAEYGPAKRWPTEHFAAVANAKIAQGWQVWIFGGKKEMEIAEQIDSATSFQCVNLVGKTSLLDAVDLLSCATAVVTNDSGLMHISAALNKPVVVIYGSSDPGFTPPLTSRAEILSLNLECSPCFKRECPYGHYRCLQDLLPQQVVAAIDRLLDKKRVLI